MPVAVNVRSDRWWRVATFVGFMGIGVVASSWVVRTPAIRTALDVSTFGMGVVILCLSIGSMTGLFLAGRLVARLGGRSSIVVSVIAMCLGMALLGVGTAVSSEPLAAGGLALLGAGSGIGEVALNVEGSALEKRRNRSFLPLLHGAFSLGTLLGAALGALAEFLDVPLVWHFCVIAVSVASCSLGVVRFFPPHTGKVATAASKSASSGVAVWKNPQILLIGLIALGMAFVEGTANDWLTLSIVDGYSVSPTAASACYIVFVASMTVTRLLGGGFVDRFGRVACIRTSAGIATVGVLLVVLSSDAPLVALVAGCALWGTGVALGFPLAISAAAATDGAAAEQVGAVSILGYTAFLVGPPFLGLLGEHLGLLNSFYAVVGAAVLAVLASGAAARTPRSAGR
ncbi:MFS transporter [Rhodococcus sp. NPDC057529]|uniref:MFS transporter n=1 Tax=Rhodococcus sp. NPDC057529 TaxID=3346158 RepID=UPI0036723741